MEAIAALRRLRMTAGGDRVRSGDGALDGLGGPGTDRLGQLSRLEPPEPPNRYERRHPGELIHIDVKKLGRIRGGAGHRITGKRSRLHRNRGIGWDFVHVCVDDATRLAYVEVLADEQATSVVAFLKRAVAFYCRHGITVQRVMTDNRLGLPAPRCTHWPAAR